MAGSPGRVVRGGQSVATRDPTERVVAVARKASSSVGAPDLLGPRQNLLYVGFLLRGGAGSARRSGRCRGNNWLGRHRRSTGRRFCRRRGRRWRRCWRRRDNWSRSYRLCVHESICWFLCVRHVAKRATPAYAHEECQQASLHVTFFRTGTCPATSGAGSRRALRLLGGVSSFCTPRALEGAGHTCNSSPASAQSGLPCTS